MSSDPNDRVAPARDAADGGHAETAVVTAIEERLDIGRRLVETGGGVRLRKLVHEEVVTVDETVTTETSEVERVAVGRPLDAPVAVRHEGDVMIVPVVEERLVTTTQLVLVEEIRVTRRRETRSVPREVTLRREEIVVERLDPASGEWLPQAAGDQPGEGTSDASPSRSDSARA